MKKNLFRSVAYIAVVLLLGGPATVLAHPGHGLYDVNHYQLSHYQSNPYHLAVSAILGVVLFYAIVKGRKYLHRLSTRNTK